MIVEIALRGIGAVFSCQHGAHQFLGSGFAIAAGDGDEWDIELFPVMFGQVLQGGEHIFNNEYALIGMGWWLIHDGIGCACLQRLLGKIVTVEIRALQCEIQIAGFERTGIGLNRRVLLVDLI